MKKHQDELLGLSAIAQRYGWTYGTVRALHNKSAKRRREDDVRAGDLPEPDQRFGRSPVWLSSTLEAWIDARPGSGVGPRPRARKNADA